MWNTVLSCNSSINVTIINLEKYTEYEITVSAFNSAGGGNFSEVTRCFTDEDSELIHAGLFGLLQF